jgi:hypothetical protein
MNRALERLWAESVPATKAFAVADLEPLPEPAKRFLEHSIRDGAPCASAVRLKMSGEIKLKGWVPFRAEQVISYPHGFVWSARAGRRVAIHGYDRLLGDEGEMNWKILALFPVMSASGPDVSRSAAGRMAGELCWVPTALLSQGVEWGEPEGEWQPVQVPAAYGPVALRLRIGSDGRLHECQIERWKDAGGGLFMNAEFGVVFHGECEFGPFTIGSELSAGWGYPQHADGEFFRAVVEHAEFR